MTTEPATQSPPPEFPDGDTHFSYTISPRTETLIRLRTLPDAVCRIRLDDRTERSAAVIASPTGYIDLYSTTTAEGEIRRITVEAENAKKSAEHVIDIRCAGSPTDDAPSPAVLPWPSSPKDIQLPALSEEEYRDSDRAELMARGYPSRPDPDAAPAAYRTWCRVVSRPLTIVAPSHVPNPDIGHGRKVKIGEKRGTPTGTGVVVDPSTIHPDYVETDNSFNWCGGELRYIDGRSFDEVEGAWMVPNVSLDDAASGSADVAIWVGLDGGEGQVDLLQGGTIHSVSKNAGHVVTTHQAWSELLPNQPWYVVLNNLPVAPNVQIQCTVAVVDRNNAPAHNGVNGLVDVINLATQQMGRAVTPLGGTFVSGRQADWIFERVTAADNQLTWLATFPNSTITQAYAVPSDISQPSLPWYTPSADGVACVFDSMDNSANVMLAYPILVNNDQVGAGWKQSH